MKDPTKSYLNDKELLQMLLHHNNYNIKEQQELLQMKDTVSGGQMLQHQSNNNIEEQQEFSTVEDTVCGRQELQCHSKNNIKEQQEKQELLQMKDTTKSYMNDKELLPLVHNTHNTFFCNQ